MCFLFSSSDHLVWPRIIIKRNSNALQNISKMLSELLCVLIENKWFLGESENRSFSILNINNICHFIRQDVLTARLDGNWSVKRKIVLFTRRLLWLLNKRAFFRKHYMHVLIKTWIVKRLEVEALFSTFRNVS